MLHYIIQIIIFQLLFLIVFELFLKKETFFSYNRVYLLVTPVLAIVLPLLKIPVLQAAIPTEGLVLLPEVFIGQNTETSTIQTQVNTAAEGVHAINWWLIAYGAGILFSLGMFVKKFRILKQLFSYKPVLENGEMKIVEVPNSTIACTFLNTIFLGTDLTKIEREQILSHEMVHVRQRHTLDLLFFEFLKIIFWFNPLIYIYQSRISTIHEFLADAVVVKNVKKHDYFQQLLNSAFNSKDISFINQFFNHSIIKKRIVMLQKNRSRSTSKFKYLIILPLMLAMLTYVSCSSTKTTNEQAGSTGTPPPPPPAPSAVIVNEQNDSDPNLPIPFAVVEKVPVYPGCENLSTEEEKKKCISEKINMFVNRNFNTNLGKELGLTGINRVYVQFMVSASGDVIEVKSRAPHPELGAEAERVVGNLPNMEPAVQKGEKVSILYSLPIVFNIPEPETTDEKEENQN